MYLRKLGDNETEVSLGTGTVLFSYETPVAANVDGKFYKTDEFFSVTTSRHINKWLNGANAEVVPQSFFRELVSGK